MTTETPNQQTPTPLTDEFVNKVVSDKGQMGFSVKEIIKLGDFARQQEIQLQEAKAKLGEQDMEMQSMSEAYGLLKANVIQLQKQNQELRSVAEVVVAKVESGKMFSKETYALAKKVLQPTMPSSPLFTKEDVSRGTKAR